MSTYLALSTSFQDASQLGPVRAFSLIGSADCVVEIEAADTTSRTPPGVPVADPNGPLSPTPAPIILRGPYMRTPTFLEAGQALRYVLKEGTTVTACWVDAAPMPNSGPAGTPGPNWLSNNSWALVTGSAYVAIAGELVKVNTGGAVTVTLPTAVGIAGQRIRIQDATGTAATHNITVATTGGQTVNGAAPNAITTNNGGQTYVSDGTNWILG